MIKRSDGSLVIDSEGFSAVYMSAIKLNGQANAGTATFLLPPLPKSSQNPTDPIAAGATNAYRFETRVYNPNATSPVGALIRETTSLDRAASSTSSV